jgi:hypothetical protein
MYEKGRRARLGPATTEAYENEKNGDFKATGRAAVTPPGGLKILTVPGQVFVDVVRFFGGVSERS